MLWWLHQSSRKPTTLVVGSSRQGGINNISHYELQNFLIKILNFIKTEYVLDIKLHPMEEMYRKEWENTLYKNNIKANILKIPNNIDFLTKYLIKYDILIGFYSTLQIQGYLLNIPTIFYNDNIEKCLHRYFTNKLPLSEHNEFEQYNVSEDIILNDLSRLNRF